MLKVWPEKGFEWRRTSFLCFQTYNHFSRFSLHIKKNISISPLMLIMITDFLFLNLLFHAILTSYFSTFTYPLACTGSTISSFLLFIPNKLMKWLISTCTSLAGTTAIHRFMKNIFPSLLCAVALVGCFPRIEWQFGSLQWKTLIKAKKKKTVKTSIDRSLQKNTLSVLSPSLFQSTNKKKFNCRILILVRKKVEKSPIKSIYN